jgi:predicted PhzF superfamily epimerase YddE/YHI9
MSGELTVERKGNLYEMDFPRYELREITVTSDMEAAFGIRPQKAILGLDLICVFETEDEVRKMHPNQEMLKGIEGRIQNATAKGLEFDCVSRSFAPKLSITEDPVCGSGHCHIIPYWVEKLEKNNITAFQASKRSGVLHGKMNNDNVIISGEATLFCESTLNISI